MAGNEVTLTFAGDASPLTREAKKAERALDDVGDASKRTADDLDRISKKGGTLAGSLANAAKNASSQAARTGFTLGAQIADGLSEGVKSVPLPLKAALAGATALLVPALGAAVATAVVGGVGAGGVVGGVVLAAQDPRVKTAGAALGEQLKSEFQVAASGFVDPVLRSIDKVGKAGFADKLAPSLDKLASKVDPLTDGLLGLADNAIPGLESAIDAAGPVLDVLADSLPEVGAALGDFFESVSADPEALAILMDRLMDTTVDTIEFIGDFTESMVEMYGWVVKAGGALGYLDISEKQLIKRTDGAAEAVEVLTQNTEDSTEAMVEFDKAIHKAFGQVMGVREATLRYEQAQDDLVGELKEGKRTLDAHTQAGRDNWQAINDQAKAIEDMRAANVANGMAVDKANEQYDQQLASLEDTLLALGFNKTEVKKYIEELRKIPAKAWTEVKINGTEVAIGQLLKIIGALTTIAGFGPAGAIIGALGGRASGGHVQAGADYLVGEHGPELLSMKSGGGGYVYSASQTASMSGSGGGRVVLEVHSDGTETGELLVQVLQRAVRVRGGDVQLVLGAGNRG